VSDRTFILEPLSKFVLEVLPWALSGLIGLYLLWGFCFATVPPHGSVKPLNESSAPVATSGARIVSALSPAHETM
jgi:hypothetical protein